MKKVIVIVMACLLMATVVSASSNDGVRVGASAAFPVGGDINNGELGGGVQGIIPLAGPINIELSASKFDDSLEVTSMSLVQFAATLRLNLEIVDGCVIYAGGGVNYNQMTADVDCPGVEVQMEDVVGYHASVGLETKVKGNLSVFLDYRQSWINTTAIISCDCSSEVVEGTYNHGLARAGLNYRF